jgi:hypothetical protein
LAKYMDGTEAETSGERGNGPRWLW